MKWEEIERLNKQFPGEQKGKLLFISSKIIPIMPLSPISIGSGLIRMKYKAIYIINVHRYTAKILHTRINWMNAWKNI